MSQVKLGVNLEEMPQSFVRLLDLNEELGDVQYIPFTIPQQEDSRTNWRWCGWLGLIIGLFFATLLHQNDKFAGIPTLIAICLISAGAICIALASFVLVGPPPPEIPTERLGVFLTKDGLSTWNGSLAWYIPRNEISNTRITPLRSTGSVVRSTELIFRLPANQEWVFPQAAIREPNDMERVAERARTGTLPT